MAMRERNTTAAGLTGSAAFALVLAACAPQQDVASASAPGPVATARPAVPPAGGPRLTGASIGGMSEQYAHPRPGPVAAVGANAWVEPSPEPAFAIATPLPPADPPAPPPAAVANRQPAPRPAPAAAPTAAPAPAAANVDLAKGRALFSQYGCGGCHILADGGGTGGIGPALDGNPRLTHDLVAGAISEGRGTMPAFRDQMSAEEIATLAAYIVQVARK
jgi:mono/diheme cytochrome c family protein